jgi:hypothetical protein
VYLELRWPTGSVMRRLIEVEQILDIQPEAGGKPFVQTTRQRVELRVECRPGQAPGEPAQLRLRLEAVEASLSGSEGIWQFDSRAGPPPAPGTPLAGLADLVGREVQITLGASGRPGAVTGLAAFAGPGAADALLHEDFFRRLIEETTTGFPAHPVRPGDTWAYEQSRALPGFGMLLGRIEARLESRETRAGREIARVTTRGTLSNRPGQNLPDGRGGSLRFLDTTGQVKGTLVFDLARGQVAQAEIRQDCAFTVLSSHAGEQERARATLSLRARDELREVVDWTPEEAPGYAPPMPQER